MRTTGIGLHSLIASESENGLDGQFSSFVCKYVLFFNPLLVITGSEIACVRVVGKCGVL